MKEQTHTKKGRKKNSLETIPTLPSTKKNVFDHSALEIYRCSSEKNLIIENFK
jgi:hypothetical protein